MEIIDKEWLYIGIFILVLLLILIVCIVNIVRWYINYDKKVKSGEIEKPELPFGYYKKYPEEFSIEHTYSIMKGPMGQNIFGKERKILIGTICTLVLFVIMINSLTWLAKRGIIATGMMAFLGALFMVAIAVLYFKCTEYINTKLWVCPHCKKPLMRVQLSSNESKEYWDNPKAIFIRHRWGRRNLLLVADNCPYCKKSYIDSNNADLYDEKESFDTKLMVQTSA